MPVAVACRVLKLHRQHYYAWLAHPVTDSELEQVYLANAIFDAHREDPEFGYRLLFDEVTDAGHVVSERPAPGNYATAASKRMKTKLAAQAV